MRTTRSEGHAQAADRCEADGGAAWLTLTLAVCCVVPVLIAIGLAVALTWGLAAPVAVVVTATGLVLLATRRRGPPSQSDWTAPRHGAPRTGT